MASLGFAIVAIGASAGGLEAFTSFVSALPADTGMAFILVQHLDPTHQSLMADLLAEHTSMMVRQVVDGMLVEPERVYVIPPGHYLSFKAGALHLTRPDAGQNVRLPFDFLLNSLAEAHGANTIGVILSGTGADGSIGLKAVRERGGFVIAQDPEEAAYGDMPRNAMKAGAVGLVLPAALIPQALLKHKRGAVVPDAEASAAAEDGAEAGMSEIVALLHARTAHDFKLHKHGTLRRRIERRMALAGIESPRQYLDVLRSDANELDLFAKDLLINVTSFFRDAKAFDFLAKEIIPDLVRERSPDRPIRIWIAGCSTGEEAYSLIMLFREEIARAKRQVKLQVFATDVDADAVASAREGVYPESIKADISPERLARFFAGEKQGYRVSTELRASVVFTVHDVLADPPFSNLDVVSCRNLLIYLGPEAQARAISHFHFALVNGGVLFLGNSEVAGNVRGRFDLVSKSEHVYRHIGRARPGELKFLMKTIDPVWAPPRANQGAAPPHPSVVADLCRRLVIENYAPAAMLVTRDREVLYSLGPTDKYIRVAPGLPVVDLLAMARDHVRAKLGSAIAKARQKNARVVVASGRAYADAGEPGFRIAVEPVQCEGRDLLFVCFFEEAKPATHGDRRPRADDNHEVADLKEELRETQAELRDALRNLESSSEEQRAINEETLSVNEEFQATNEELLTSKEELQSLNEELTALNTQLQETLERQRTTSNDLQNVLNSTDVATLFLDTKFKIRFFTPATKALFNVIPSDIGRPLTDLHALAADGALFADAQTVLKTLAPIERETQTSAGVWYSRRILPYRTDDHGVEGVVITFTDITERKRFVDALAAAKRHADRANAAKSRFLAAASHDLRQPLQTITLVHGLLAKAVEGEKAKRYVERLDGALGTMSELLNTLLEVNQIEAGTIEAHPIAFPITEMLARLKDEFTYHAESRKLVLRVVPSALVIHSDPNLLEQMIRNLLSNALKFTDKGKILLGCRRRKGALSLEVWDTGIGIPAEHLEAIFDEYHQLGNDAREAGRGVGLGLSIVKRLGDMLGHRVRVRSRPGGGSVFAIEVALAPGQVKPLHKTLESGVDKDLVASGRPVCDILIVEDDPQMRDLLELALNEAGHRTAVAADGVSALELVGRGRFRPDILLSDYNLPRGMNGVALATTLREKLHHAIPVIILTGDISTDALGKIALQNCARLKKPVKFDELEKVIADFLAAPQPSAISPPTPKTAPAADGGAQTIFVVDDDVDVREALSAVLAEDGHPVLAFASSEDFLEAYHPGRATLLLIDAYLPGMSGLALLQRLHDAGDHLPAIMITGNSDVPMAVQAMKAGASDFIEKPIRSAELLASVARALEQSRDSSKLAAWREEATTHVASLTPRQREVMERVLAGHPSKNIAADLGISQRTVENHRAAIMKRTGTKSLPALARLALAAGDKDGGDPVA